MTGPVVVVLLCVLVAVGVVTVLLRAHAPEEGLLPWLREAMRTWRSHRVNLADAAFTDPAEDDDGEDLRVADLLHMGESGPGYQEPVDLRVVVDRVRSGR